MISRATVPGAYLCDFLPFRKWTDFDAYSRSAETQPALACHSKTFTVMASVPTLSTRGERHDRKTRNKAVRAGATGHGALFILLTSSTCTPTQIRVWQAKGTALPSLTQDLLTEVDNESLYNHIKWSTGSLYGGENSVASALQCERSLIQPSFIAGGETVIPIPHKYTPFEAYQLRRPIPRSSSASSPWR